MPAAFSISPNVDLIDVPRRIALAGLPAGAEVVIAAETPRDGHLWRAEAVFRAGADGSIDLGRDAPVRGDYAGVSAMGLVWAQTGEGELFPPDLSRPLETTLTADIGGERIASGRFSQILMADGVTRRPLAEDGLVGTLFLPAGAGPHPAIVILNGSGGGINEPRAALYASHGYAALALGYFKCPGRSDYISDTHLEYFETALQWMHEQLRSRNDFVALSGQSRGGELVLLLGSLFPDRVSAVIGYVPAALVHSAQNACDPANGPDSRNGPAWIFRSQPLPHLWENNRTATWAPWDEGPEPRRHTHALLTALQDPQAVERARIAVERIRGPVMLLSASDDGSWPSSLYGRMVAERLQAHHHPHPVEHLDFEGAGHAIVFPYVPTTQLTYRHPVSGRLSTTGGAPAPNAHADEASWAAVRVFLQRAVDGVQCDGKPT